MARGTRSRTPGKDDEKRQLLASLSPPDFPSLIADILYFSKGHRHVRVMDGPGDGCRDIQSSDKDETAVITQCKCFEDPDKTVGSPDANELVVALTKFGKTRGIMATTGRFSPQLKREFTDNFPQLHLDWLDGADIVDEVFSNPLLFRAWVTGNTMGRETIYVKVPFIIRRGIDDTPVELEDADLGDGLAVDGKASIDVGSLERFRPPESVHWTESFGTHVRCSALLMTSPHDLHRLEDVHVQALNKIFVSAKDVVTVRFGIPHLVPTKNPDFEKGMRIPGFVPRSYVVRPANPPTREHDFLLLSSPTWKWPDYLSAAEGDWGNWQTADNQRWCHVQVHGPSFPNSTQSQICRMIGESKRRELRDAQAIFITATNDVCERIAGKCSVEPDVRCANGPGGELLGWSLRDKAKRDAERAEVQKVISEETAVEILALEDAIHITSRSEDPLVPTPGGEQYYPAQLVWEFDELPSPHYLKGRSCTFVEVWKVPVTAAQAREAFEKMSFGLPDDWKVYVQCKNGPKTKQAFPMISVGVPWPIDRSTTELVTEVAAQVDQAFDKIGAIIKGVWADAYCATSEFWDVEIRFPAGAYIATDKGLVRSNWWPEPEEKGDD